MAEELAVEHCSFYGDKTSKAVKGFFLNQIYRSWVPNYPKTTKSLASIAPRHDKESIYEKFCVWNFLSGHFGPSLTEIDADKLDLES